ncbi:MAG: hypothetical protein HDS64_06285 [Bacteroidales bacterium]|nr:hypothetical protein [Bacteroidales bacterium]MBD5281577.1 hypothetical protein [Bacteroides sp.]MDE6032382.1 hypothetical protein [Muribaculaceae bacterium]MBD5294490.1 hypothetical protein [Bacteroides sp.]MBD5353100.1 hypothetical protein [Bacteroides sp.]
MKFKTSAILTVLTVVATLGYVTACDSSSRLATKISGPWSGTSVRFDKKTVTDGTYTPVYEFTKVGSGSEGTVTMTARISITLPINSQVNAEGTAPVSATAAAVATVSGLWHAHDEDEIKLAFDPATLKVDVDPDVQFAIASVLTNYDTDSTATVSPQVLKAFRDQATHGMNDVITKIHEFDDIHFQSDNMMTAEIHKQRQTFVRPQ